MIKKTNYETPLAELIVVRFEENILLSFSDKGTEKMSVEEEEDF